VAALIDDARRRQRRRRIVLAAFVLVACAGLAVGLAVATSGGSGRSASPPRSAAARRWRWNAAGKSLPQKLLVVVAPKSGRIVRMKCARPAESGTPIWVVVAQTPQLHVPLRCPG
jgi:hypothetical protein